MPRRALVIFERILSAIAAVIARIGSLFLVVYALTYLFGGAESQYTQLFSYLYAAATIALMVAAGLRLALYRTILAVENAVPMLLFSIAPIACSLGNVAMYVPNAVLSALIALMMVGRTIATPVRTRQMQRAVQGGQAQDGTQAEPEFMFPAVPPQHTFQTVTGMLEVKARLLEAGKEVVESQRKGKALSTRNGIMLFGEPGNGKTMFAEALAGELKLPMISVTFGDVASKWINSTTEQVMRAFADARAQAPCLLFLDEIDSLIKDRNDSMSGGSDEAAKTTNALLTELVKIRSYPVVLIAATNFIDKLDQAAVREKRFDFKVEITPPDQQAREALLVSSLKHHRQIVLSESARVTAARRWQGFSAARICAVAEEAVRSAVKLNRAKIEYPDLQKALRTTQGRAGYLPEGTPSIDELVLAPSQKQKLVGLATRMREIERIEELGGTVPTGMLFWGPPGTGKTLTARALAKTSEWAFISAAGNELLSKPDRIEQLARQARDLRPCIIFIDEADDVLADRRYSQHSASVTNRLLTAVDGAGGKVADVVWIAATNHPENMDAAALRGGRFTEKVEFGVPDLDVVAEFARRWIERSKAKFAACMTPNEIARELDGLTIANVGAVMQQAVDIMIERSVTSGETRSVSIQDIIDARASVVSMA